MVEAVEMLQPLYAALNGEGQLGEEGIELLDAELRATQRWSTAT